MGTVAIILWTITGTSAAWALYLGYNINKAMKCLSRNLDQLKEDYYEHGHDQHRTNSINFRTSEFNVYGFGFSSHGIYSNIYYGDERW